MEVLKVALIDPPEEIAFIDKRRFDIFQVSQKSKNKFKSDEYFCHIFFLNKKITEDSLKKAIYQSEGCSKVFYIFPNFERLAYSFLENQEGICLIHHFDEEKKKKKVFQNFIKNQYDENIKKEESSLKKEEIRNLGEELKTLQNQFEKKSEDLQRIVKASAQRLKAFEKRFFVYKNLFSVLSTKDFFLFIKEQIKIFHGIRSVTLFSRQKDKHILFSFDGFRVANTKEVLNVNLEDLEKRKDLHRQFLADTLIKPFVKVISAPFYSGAQSEMILENILFFEHTFDEAEKEIFENYLEEHKEIWNFILQRVRLEQHLFDSFQIWENTFNGVKDPIALTDKESKAIRYNQAFLNKKDILESFKNFQEITENKEIHFRSRKRLFKVYSYPVKDFYKDNKKIYLHHYVDMTEHESIKSKAIQNEKLAAIGHLAGDFSQKLREPLDVIERTLGKMCLEKSSDSSIAKDAKNLCRSVSVCKNILLEITNLFSSSADAKKQSVEINDLLSRTLPFLKVALRPYQYMIEYHDEPLVVEAIPQMLQQIFFNIILNACQAMRERGGSLKIKTGFKDEEGTVFFEVEDTGPGIPHDVLDKVFEPFFTTKSKSSGTGLGLSFCKNVIEKFGGKITVSSQLKKGTKFSIFLPRIFV